MARYTIDKNGNVVFLQSDGRPTAPLEVTTRTNRKSPTGHGKTGANKRPKANKRRKGTPSMGEKRRQTKGTSAPYEAAKEALKRTEEKSAAVEWLDGFDEAYALGEAASQASSPNYRLAIAAFKRAYRIDPRRKVRSGEKPDPGLFEVPTKIAAAYRLNGQFHEAQKMCEWVLGHYDSRIARMELATVHEDNCDYSQALKLYEELVLSDPHDVRALHGVARMLAKLGRGVEAQEARIRAVQASRG